MIYLSVCTVAGEFTCGIPAGRGEMSVLEYSLRTGKTYFKVKI